MTTFANCTPIPVDEKTADGLTRPISAAVLRLLADLAEGGALIYADWDLVGRNGFTCKAMVAGVEPKDEAVLQIELKPAL